MPVVSFVVRAVSVCMAVGCLTIAVMAGFAHDDDMRFSRAHGGVISWSP